MDVFESEVLANIEITKGYYDTDKLTAPTGSMAVGSRNVFLTEDRNQRIFRGLLPSGNGGRSMFNVAGGIASLNDIGSTEGTGSVFNYINESLFMIGSGSLYYKGVDTGEDASSSLKLSTKESGYIYSTWYTAGLDQPDAPTVTAMTPSSGFSGLNTGLNSYKIARVRSLTGGRSIASATSAVIYQNGQTARLTFPTAASNGQDRWAIFKTKDGFGGTGAHYLVQEINETDLSTIDGVARSYELEVNDSDLLPVLAYIDDYPPQAGLFAARLENYVLIIGCYDNAIAASIRNFPESFNPEHLGFLPSTPTAILNDPQGSYVYVSTDSSVHAVSVIPSNENPLVIQTVWSNVGVAHNHNWCSVGGVIFAFTAKSRAVTMNALGQPTQDFALPVSKAMREWDVADVVVNEVPHLNSVMYAHQDEAFLYNVQTGEWSSPAMLSDFATGDIVSAVVHDRQTYISLNNSGTFTLYEFDNGTQDINVVIQSPPTIPMDGYRTNVLGLIGRFYSPHAGTYSIDLLDGFDGSTLKTLTHITGFSGLQSTVKDRWYKPRLEGFAVKWSGTLSDPDRDMYLSNIMVYGTLEESRALTRTSSVTLTDDSGVVATGSDGNPITYP